jgi:putative ABC transport system permease protein
LSDIDPTGCKADAEYIPRRNRRAGLGHRAKLRRYSFAFTSIAVVNTLIMIALQRGRELGLLRLVGGTPGQIRSMARWEAGLIITIGLGLGLAIAATALLPLSHALTGNLRPYVPLDQLAAILGVSALLALLALTLPARRALRSRPVEAIGLGE